MIEKAPGTDNTVDIATWDGQLTAAFDIVEKMISMIFFTSRISSPIAGLEKGGVADSGRALKWRSINTFSAVQRRRVYYEAAHQKFFNFLKRLDPSIKGDVSDLQMIWRDGIPLDNSQIIDDVTQQVMSQIMSKKTAIMQVQEIDEKAALEEQDQILLENGQSADIEARRFSTTLCYIVRLRLMRGSG